MSTREIRPSSTHDACDVCGRTLLRGERAEIYLGHGARHAVCELCTSRALHDGWVREGELPEYDQFDGRTDRRRSLFGRLRNRRDGRGRQPEPPAEPELPLEPPLPEESPPEPSSRRGPRAPGPPRRRSGGAPGAPVTPAYSPAWPDPVRTAAARIGVVGGEGARREPRHVRAVPTSIEHRISSAVKLFNDSEHPRRVAGIARSLGLPDVSVYPSDVNSGQVNIIVSWELCWYRYEVDLSDEVPTVRSAAQGSELSELTEIERQNNAAADERGRLDLSRR